jgi:excisionase family DNA binding protein
MKRKASKDSLAVGAKDAAELLGISKRSFDEIVKSGEIPFWRIRERGDRRFAVRDLELFIERRKGASDAKG